MCVFGVITGHTYFLQYFHNKNPEFFEEVTKNPRYLWLTNGTVLLENFHVLSGMLLYIKFKELFQISPKSSKIECFKVLCKGLVMRFIRWV